MQDVEKKIVDIIKANFPNGLRDDFIDAGKVLRIYSANYSDEKIPRTAVIDVIRANGIESDGRFYFLPADAAEHVLLIFDEFFETNSIVYYAAAYEKHCEFFTRKHIYSPEVLRKILREIDTVHFYSDEFCSASKMTRLDYEVSKIFAATDGSLSLEDLQGKLPYVPTDKISAVLSDRKKFLPTITGKYIPVSGIKFDFDEIEAAKQQISDKIDANGCAAPEDYNLSSNLALNPELAEKDLRNVIYEKFFAYNFTRRGKKFFRQEILATTSGKRSFKSELKKFLASRDEISFDSLINYFRHISDNEVGGVHIPLRCAFDSMVRVSENLFVKDALINFDVAGIDEALTPFVQGKIIPLCAVTSFTGFPPVEGYSWNLFLLESFLRKYSRRYAYDTPVANNANTGAIYPKSMKFKDYLDVQASAVVQENIPLEKSAVEEFLIGQGYRKNRIDKVTERVIARAQEIIDGRR